MKLKEIPEDFIVREIFDLHTFDKGKYTYFKLWKKNYTTIKALQTIGRRFKIPLKKFGFAGNKDKRAVTVQYCSVQGKIWSFESPNLKVEVLGKGDEPISLGDHEGNEFEITVRDISKRPQKLDEFKNYYGMQRFSKNNVTIGRAIVKKNFMRAALLIEDENAQEYLEKNPKNYIGALRKVPRKILKLYVHSYQSFIWNQCVKNYEGESFPLFGFGTEIEDEEQQEIIDRIKEKEKIDVRDFIIKEIPELSAEGGDREVYAEVRNLEISKLSRDEYSARKKVKVCFRLGKGSYATEFIKQLF